MSHAWAAGYGEMLPRGLFPVGALLLEVDPHEVDVNVHPAKTEVRLSQERKIHDILYHIVKESLQKDGVIPAFRQHQPMTKRSFQEPSVNPPENSNRIIPGIMSNQVPDADKLKEFYNFTGQPLRENSRTPDDTQMEGTDKVVQVDTQTGEIIEDVPDKNSYERESGPSTGFRLVGRFSDLYLLLQAENDLFIVISTLPMNGFSTRKTCAG